VYKPSVIQVYAIKNYKVVTYFSDGKITLFDMSNDLNGVFEVLKDKEIFNRTLTILDNTAACDLTGKRDDSDCLTICPDTLYISEDITDREDFYLLLRY